MKSTLVITAELELDADPRDPASVEAVHAAVRPFAEAIRHRVAARGVKVLNVGASVVVGDDAAAALRRAMGAT